MKNEKKSNAVWNFSPPYRRSTQGSAPSRSSDRIFAPFFIFHFSLFILLRNRAAIPYTA
jgi:hypothetical protein